MSTVIIIVIAVIFVVVVASVMVGRTDYEVESVRDTEFIELEGHWIRYNVIGGGPPVLLVHGWLLSSRIWEQLARRLAQRFTVYTLDLTGFGESDKPIAGYGVRYGSRLLYSFCAHFGISRAGVIAHDLGGDMAVKLAADHPDIVGRLVLVATPAEDSQIDLPTMLWLTTLPVVGPLFFMLGRLLRPFRKLWMRHFVLDSNDLSEEIIEDPAQSTPAAVGKTLTVTKTEISGSRLLRQAGIIKVPVLLVAGERDRIVDPQSVTDWGQSISQAEIAILDDCGHLPMVEKPGELGARILAFLTGDERYMNYAREAPTAVPEPPAETEPEETPAKEPVSEGHDDHTAAEDVEEPQETSSKGGLGWEFDVGDMVRPGKTRRSGPQEKQGQDVAPEQREDETERAKDEAAEQPEEQQSISHRSRSETPQKEEPAAEERPASPPDDATEQEDRPRPRRKSSGAGSIPEFPEDLFQWSDEPRESRKRRSPRNRPEEPEEPSEGTGSSR